MVVGGDSKAELGRQRNWQALKFAPGPWEQPAYSGARTNQL